MSEPHDPEGFLRIFTFKKKRELDKYCRDIIVYYRDFTTFIMCCERGLMPFVHKAHYRDYRPEHLEPSDEELTALFKSRPGEELTYDAAKTAQKLFIQSPRERRYLVGHIFYRPNLLEWHFFYFDQWDLEEREPNHWQYGSHIHFINYLWPQHDAQSLWSKFVSSNVQMGGSLHMRFVERHG